MKQYLLATHGNESVLVEWDVEAGRIRLTIKEESGVVNVLGYEEAKLKQGIIGVDEVAWKGQRMTIMKHVHDYFVREYPTFDLPAEYLKADEWAVRNGRVIKNAQSFMSNWLKKARGGNQSRGGVIY